MLRDQLSELLAPVVAGLGYELWELEFAPRAGGGLLRLYIDSRRTASALDDCERVSRAVSETLDAADPIPGHYTLEVSSPGLDRVLRTREHFERFAGEQVRLEMMQPIERAQAVRRAVDGSGRERHHARAGGRRGEPADRGHPQGAAGRRPD